MRRLWKRLRAGIAFDYLHEVRREHLARYPQLACLAFDHIGIIIAVEGRADKETLDFIAARLADRIRGRTVCDVGANVGNHSLALAEHAARVVALEPHPLSFELLRINCRAHPNIVPLNLAASDRRGTADAAVPATNFGGARIAAAARPGEIGAVFELVPLDALTELAEADLGLVKIDVEGHEEQVLRGAEALLRHHRPAVILEQNEDAIADGTSPSLELLKRLGYRHFHALEAPPAWRVPDSVPRPLRRLLRGAEALLAGPPPRRARAVPIDRLEQRAYPMLIATVEAVDWGERA